MDTEDLIRTALDLQADRAPAAERTREALPVRTRARRRRRLAVGASAAAVATAVLLAAPIVAVRGWPGGRSHPITVGSSTSSSATAAPASTGYVLGYRPTWLPDGLVERDRKVTTAGSRAGIRSRLWSAEAVLPPMATPLRYVSLVAEPPAYVRTNLLVTSRPVDVNGVSGTLAGTSPNLFTEVHWVVDANTALVVRVGRDVPDPTAVAIRVARSVVVDTMSRLEAPLTLGWLPERVGDEVLSPGRMVVLSGDSPAHWQLAACFDYTKPNTNTNLGEGFAWYVSIGTYRATFTGGTPVTVRGRTGTVVTPHNGGKFDSYVGMLQVDLDGGLVLTLQAGSVDPGGDPKSEISAADMVRIANSVDIGSPIDLTWIGR